MKLDFDNLLRDMTAFGTWYFPYLVSVMFYNILKYLPQNWDLEEIRINRKMRDIAQELLFVLIAIGSIFCKKLS